MILSRLEEASRLLENWDWPVADRDTALSELDTIIMRLERLPRLQIGHRSLEC